MFLFDKNIFAEKISFLSILLFFTCLPVFSQNVKALVGGTLIDGFGGKPMQNTVIIIEGERIKAIGQIEMVDIPQGAEIISTEGMNEFDFDAMYAIKAATYWPAFAMKVAKDYGTIKEGKYADIIAVKGDVLRYISLLQNVDTVIKHGKRVK